MGLVLERNDVPVTALYINGKRCERTMSELENLLCCSPLEIAYVIIVALASRDGRWRDTGEDVEALGSRDRRRHFPI